MNDPSRLRTAYLTARDALLAERTPDGHWVGELSASALSTATACAALSLASRHIPGTPPNSVLVARGLRWLGRHQNADGGWGDTTKSFSNISTTMLVRAAFHITESADEYAEALKKADAWLAERYGATSANHAEAVRKRYGVDRTFSVPILMMSALGGLVEWREVPPLPFELACLPQSWYRFARLPVVSYALPALIAIGQAVAHHRGTWNPTRKWAVRPSLNVLKRIQPSSGGYLEATPLTSFVVMALASKAEGLPSAGLDVIQNGVKFIIGSVRPDGSWAIDSNLATWLTTLSVNALAAAGDLESLDKQECVRDWLLRQQYTERHPFTGAEPGGWAWTDLPGGVPDADDTPGAILALGHLTGEFSTPPARGLRWLCGLRNGDGGMPTFCHGWGTLPFDRSGSDQTAHALRAAERWRPDLDREEAAFRSKMKAGYRVRRAGHVSAHNARVLTTAGLRYLAKHQRPDGSWLPLWFGNQHAPDDANPTYGTSRVLAAYRDLKLTDRPECRRGVAWLLHQQNPDGGWGGCLGTPSSLEETALAVEVLLDLAPPESKGAVDRGVEWVVCKVEAGGLYDPSPIGFYFAKLWYFERLYPMIFAVAALGRAGREKGEWS